MDLNRVLESAVRAAEEAGKLLMSYTGRALQAEAKSTGNFVSQADRASEDLIRQRLLRDFPNSHVLGEEGGETPGSSGLTWIVDPLDGTNNFLHGVPHWAVSIGATYKGIPVVGVIHHPPMGELFSARLGDGADLNGRRIRVSGVRRFPEALLATGFSYDEGEALRRSIKMFQAFQDHGQTLRRPGAAALDLAYVAAGRFDGYWESGLKPWDCAAGIVLVKEAGGTVSDYAGRPYEIGDNDILVSNGALHEEMLRRLKPFA
ncbi:MAG: inositol monophosphatase [Planctomycetota bacterium]